MPRNWRIKERSLGFSLRPCPREAGRKEGQRADVEACRRRGEGRGEGREGRGVVGSTRVMDDGDKEKKRVT